MRTRGSDHDTFFSVAVSSPSALVDATVCQGRTTPCIDRGKASAGDGCMVRVRCAVWDHTHRRGFGPAALLVCHGDARCWRLLAAVKPCPRRTCQRTHTITAAHDTLDVIKVAARFDRAQALDTTRNTSVVSLPGAPVSSTWTILSSGGVVVAAAFVSMDASAAFGTGVSLVTSAGLAPAAGAVLSFPMVVQSER